MFEVKIFRPIQRGLGRGGLRLHKTISGGILNDEYWKNIKKTNPGFFAHRPIIDRRRKRKPKNVLPSQNENGRENE